MTNKNKEENQRSYSELSSDVIFSITSAGLGALINYNWFKLGMKCAKISYGMDTLTNFNNEHKAESGAIIFGGISSILLMGMYYSESIDLTSTIINYHFLTAESTLYLVGETINSSTLEYFAGAAVGTQIIYNYSDTIVDAGNSLIEMGKNIHYDIEYETL